MQNSRVDIFRKFQVLFIASCYILIAVSHMFFLPKFTDLKSRAAMGQNSIFRRKAETTVATVNHINFFQRTDKFIVNDKKSAIDLIDIVVGSFMLLLFARHVWKLNPKAYLTFNWQPVNYQYSYLSFCTFKI